METLQINKSNAVKAFNEADKSGKDLLANLFGSEVFTPKKITDRVKSYEDACIVMKVNPYDYLPYDCPATPFEKSINAFAKLQVIAQALNEGWQPNWDNTSEYKYYPWFKIQGGFAYHYVFYCYSNSYVGSRLCFKSSALAEYAGKQFLDLYKTYMTF
jgi:hypothetical protein